LTARQLALARRRCQLANRHGTKAQMHAKVARSLDGREISCEMVVIHPLKKVSEQLRTTLQAHRNFQRPEVAADKTDVSELGHRCGHVGWALGQTMRQRARVMHWQVQRLQPGQPVVFVRREHAVDGAALRQNFAFLKNYMVFAGLKGNAVLLQGLRHLQIALACQRFVVVGGKNCLYTQLLGNARQGLACHIVADDQAHLCLATDLAQRLIKLNQRFTDELDPSVNARQGVKNGAIKDKYTVQLPTLAQRRVQGQVVVNTQIAPEPHQAGVKVWGHLGRKIVSCLPILPRST